MVKEAAANAATDRLERERAEVRNDADSLLYSTEKSAQEFGDRVSKEDRSAIERATAELRAAIESRDISLMKAKTEALKKAAYRLAEEVYKVRTEVREPGGTSGDGASGAKRPSKKANPGADTETTEEADYEVVDDEKQKT